jgi:hypothetical protein
MFEAGFIEVVDFVLLRADACLAGAVIPVTFDRGALPSAAAVELLFARFLTGTGRLEVSADGAATWVLLAGVLLTGDLLVPGVAAAPVRDAARLATGRRTADVDAGSVARVTGAGCVALDPNAAWTVANASSSES